MFGDGKVSYDYETNTLTLTDYSTSGAGTAYSDIGGRDWKAGILYTETDHEEPFTIVLNGKNYANTSVSGSENWFTGILVADGELVIKGSGTLTAAMGACDSGTTLHGSFGIVTMYGSVTITDAATVKAYSCSTSDKATEYAAGIAVGFVSYMPAAVKLEVSGNSKLEVVSYPTASSGYTCGVLFQKSNVGNFTVNASNVDIWGETHAVGSQSKDPYTCLVCKNAAGYMADDSAGSQNSTDIAASTSGQTVDQPKLRLYPI